LIIVFKFPKMNTETRETPCQRRLLSQRGPFLVESCGCGMVHLTFGFMTLRVAPTAVEVLCATLLEAVEKFERPQMPAH